MKANVRATPDLTFQVDAETEEELLNKLLEFRKFFSISHVVNALHQM